MRGLMLVALLVVACDSSPNDAPAKCEELRAAFCARAVSCSNQAVDMATCEQQFATVADCGKAVSVDASYPRCLDEVRTFGCGVLFPSTGGQLPASCKAVIKVRG